MTQNSGSTGRVHHQRSRRRELQWEFGVSRVSRRERSDRQAGFEFFVGSADVGQLGLEGDSEFFLAGELLAQRGQFGFHFREARH